MRSNPNEYVLSLLVALFVGYIFGMICGYNLQIDDPKKISGDGPAKEPQMLRVYVRTSDGLLFAENGYSLGLTLQPMAEIKAEIDARRLEK